MLDLHKHHIHLLIMAYTSVLFFTRCLFSNIRDPPAHRGLYQYIKLHWTPHFIRQPKSIIIVVRFEQDLHNDKVFIHLMWQLFHEPVQSFKIDNQLLPNLARQYPGLHFWITTNFEKVIDWYYKSLILTWSIELLLIDWLIDWYSFNIDWHEQPYTCLPSE